jgi:hypothetical protein
VTPVQFLVGKTATDVVDYIYTGIAKLADLGNHALRLSQNGRTRWYAMGAAAGFIVLFAVVLFIQ